MTILLYLIMAVALLVVITCVLVAACNLADRLEPSMELEEYSWHSHSWLSR